MKHTGMKLLSSSILCIFIMLSPFQKNNSQIEKPTLKFRKDGTFKIVQLADIQDGPNMNLKTKKLINNVLDKEKPDLVLLTGDNISRRCKSKADVKKAINNIALPIENRQIPWAIVFGNHDNDNGKINKSGMMKLYMKYPFNLSRRGPLDVSGVGNYNLLVYDSKNRKPIFNIYMLHSASVGASLTGYDGIKPSQVKWYVQTSMNLKSKFNTTIPALMFFHIPIPEWKIAWKTGNVIGEKNEEEDTSETNSGLFDMVLKMGDVKGMFVGHDHCNDYVAELKGIRLGYSRNVGYATYGKKGFSRGARVFLIKESNPNYFETWMSLDEE